MCNTGNLCILLGHTFRCINHNNDHICTLYCSNCTDYTVTFQFFFDFAFTAKPCRINKDIFSVFPFNFCIDGISGRSGNVRNNHAILTEKLVDQGRFTYVWFSDDCNLRNIIIFICVCIFREFLYDFIQHITNTGTVCCGNCNRFSYSQIIKLIDIHHVFLDTVYFIYDQNNRFLASAQHIRYFCIRIHKSLLYICNKHDHVCCINRNLRLFSHL